MAGKIIMWIVTFVCAGLFYYIGVYAQRLEKPMWFWSGTQVDIAQITDVRQYNQENGTMWKLYSLWYLAAGVAEIWSTLAAAMLLVLSCTLGIAQLICTYRKIFRKYQANIASGS